METSRHQVETDALSYAQFDSATYLANLVKAGVRQDGRSLTGLRPLSLLQGILQGTTAGSALVKIGGTKVVAGVTLLVGQPAEDTPSKGEIGVEVHLPPMCHPKYTSIQIQQEEGKALETFVQNVLLKCGVVRREDLRISEGRHVWKLNVDIQCLSHEGSLGDACILAAASALADVQLPATALDKDEEVVILSDTPPRPLEMTRFPVPLTIGLHSDKFLCDLSLTEEERMPTQMTLVLDAENGHLCSAQKAGGASMASEQLARAFALCSARQKQVTRARGQQKPRSL
ncbi:exosome complex component rrp43-like [Nannochloropsis oceanica]